MTDMQRQLGSRAGSARSTYWLALGLIGLLFVVSTAPSPLYSVYQARWHFSSVVLTGIFGVYSGTVIIALNLFGSASDTVGRRRLVLAGLSCVLAALVVFALARGVTWLLAARALQGFGVGTASVALVAAVVDSRQTAGTEGAATATNVVSTLAMAIGSLGAGLFVQYVTDARVWLFVTLAVIVAFSLLAAWRIPDGAPSPASRPVTRAFRARVPRQVWARFALYAAGLSVAWAVGGLYLALAPSISSSVTRHGGRLGGAVAISILGTVGAGAAFLARGWPERRLLAAGAPPLVTGLMMVVASSVARSETLFLLGSTVMASGWGLVNIGTYQALLALSEEGRRAELVAAIYLVSYLALSVPTVLVGVAIDHVGLRLTTVVFGSVTAGFALAVVAAILTRDGSRTRDGSPSRADSACSAAGYPADRLHPIEVEER